MVLLSFARTGLGEPDNGLGVLCLGVSLSWASLLCFCGLLDIIYFLSAEFFQPPGPLHTLMGHRQEIILISTYSISSTINEKEITGLKCNTNKAFKRSIVE